MTDEPSSPEFGPRGYLPERASKRARKIILRAPMGLQWVVAAAVFGALVLVAGFVWLGGGGPPGPPYVEAGPLAAGSGPTVRWVQELDAWLVTGTGPVMAVPGEQVDELAWCEASGRLEADDGRVWSATGRGLGTPSLATHPVRVHDGVAFVDPTVTREGARPAEQGESPAC